MFELETGDVTVSDVAHGATPPNGATIYYQGNNQWKYDYYTWPGWGNASAMQFIMSRDFDTTGMGVNQVAIWSSAAQCFFANTEGGLHCIERQKPEPASYNSSSVTVNPIPGVLKPGPMPKSTFANSITETQAQYHPYHPTRRLSGTEVGDGGAPWDGVTTPPIGAKITFTSGGVSWDGGHSYAAPPNSWIVDNGGSWGNFFPSENAKEQFLASRHLDPSDFDGDVAIWDGNCFRNPAGNCQEHNIAPGASAPQAPVTPGHWEQRPKGQVWVQDGPSKPAQPKAPILPPPVHSAPTPPPPPVQVPGAPPPAFGDDGHWEKRPKGWVWVHNAVQAAQEVFMSTAQTDATNGYTHYLCYIDEYGKQQPCATMTQAQTELAMQAILATPVGAEDRKAGVIKAIDPFGKYGPPAVNPPPMLPGGSGLTISLLQYNAVMAAIVANPQAAVPVSTNASATSTSTPAAQDGTIQNADTTPSAATHNKVDFHVRILEGVAAVAAVAFVGFEIWKHARKRA